MSGALQERQERWDRHVFALDLAGIEHMALTVLTAVYNGGRVSVSSCVPRPSSEFPMLPPWPHDDAADLLTAWAVER